MSMFAELFAHITGRHKQRSPTELERQFIERLHQRLINALTDGDRDALAVLLATDTEWWHDQQIAHGRDAVIDALLDTCGNVPTLVCAAKVRLHGELAVVDALWHSSIASIQRIWTRSCIFTMRRSRWQIVSLRDLVFDQAALACVAVSPRTVVCFESQFG